MKCPDCKTDFVGCKECPSQRCVKRRREERERRGRHEIGNGVSIIDFSLVPRIIESRKDDTDGSD